MQRLFRPLISALQVLTGICLAIPHSGWTQHTAWELNKEKDGVVIRTRERAEEHTKEFQAEMTVPTSVNKLVTLIQTDSLGIRWINRAEQFKTLKIVNDSAWYSYTEISIPWPFLNKDLITYNQLFRKPDGSIAISMVSHPTYIPEKKGLSRLQHSEGWWYFTPSANGDTRVTYEVFAKSSGGLPEWIVTPIIIHGLYVTLRDLRSVVQQVQEE